MNRKNQLISILKESDARTQFYFPFMKKQYPLKQVKAMVKNLKNTCYEVDIEDSCLVIKYNNGYAKFLPRK